MFDSTIISTFSDNVIFKELFDSIKSNGPFEFTMSYLYSIIKCTLYVLFVLMVKYFVSDPTRIKTIIVDTYTYLAEFCCRTQKFELPDALYITKYLFRAKKYKNKIIINNLRAELVNKNIKIPTMFCLEVTTGVDSTLIKYKYNLSENIVKLSKNALFAAIPRDILAFAVPEKILLCDKPALEMLQNNDIPRSGLPLDILSYLEQ